MNDTTATFSPHAVLKRYFGYDAFREHQQDVIETILAGKDAFVLMPTGSGKSLCYQIPAIMRSGVGVVISPLIALMQNQVSALRQNGVKAAFLNSGLSPGEAETVSRQVAAGEIDLLYVAPERLLMDRFQAWMRRLPVALFAIDEAHCVSQWGHDFRPEYLRILEVTARFPHVPRIALTATADAVTRRDILEKLHLNHARQFSASFDRPNIRYTVSVKTNGKKQVHDFIRAGHAGHAGIVYVRTRARCDQIAAWLRDRHINALPYHAGLPPEIRALHQQQFLREDGIVMVATIAFGMGIDKPDVRFVAHLDLPASMEAYYQETGRAGRDGRDAEAWMLYSLADVVSMRKMLERSEGGEDIKRIRRQKLEALLGYSETVSCRRTALLGYFGEPYPGPCNCCDTCSRPPDTWDGTVAVQKALSCVYRTGQRFGAGHLIDVLCGDLTERVAQLGHERIKTFGVGTELSKAQWRSVFRQMLAAGLLTVDMGQIAGFRLTAESRPVLKGEKNIRLRKDPPAIRPLARKASTSRPDAEQGLKTNGTGDLFEKLRRLRLDIAQKAGLPPYVVFHDKTLQELALARPGNRFELLQIPGVGDRKADRYGQQFLDLINADEHTE